MTRAPKLCAAKGCHARVPPGLQCAKHPKPNGGWKHALPTSQRGYSTAAWKRARTACLEREPLCYICRRAKSTTADHVVPKAEGGTDSPTNLKGACKGCQATKASREGNRAKARA